MDNRLAVPFVRRAAARGLVALLLLGPPLAGCAFKNRTTGMAVEYNDFVAQTTNRQTVLNVLRAREREPMHFTSFSEVFGQVRGQGTASLGSAFNGDSGSATATDTTVTNAGATGAVTGTAVTATRTLVDAVGATNFTPNVGVQVTTGTDFKVAANASDEFYKGILNPLSPTTLIHYLRQGFPADLLSHLVIGRLEFSAKVTPPGGAPEQIPLGTIHNSPDEPVAAAEFAAAIRCRHLDYEMSPGKAKVLPVDDLASLAPIPPDLLKRLNARTDAQGRTSYEIVTPAQNDFTLLLSRPNAEACGPIRALLADRIERWARGRNLAPRAAAASPAIDGAALPGSVQVSDTAELRDSTSPQALGQPGEVKFSSVGYFNPRLPAGYQGDLIVDVTIRSVQGVMYYLGEYIRNEGTSPRLADRKACGVSYCLPILRVRPAGEIAPSTRFVEVVYRGRRYAVPLSSAVLNADAGRSSQTIDLVQQLFNLNRSAKDLPSTPLLRITN